MIHLDTSFLIRALVRGSKEDLKLRDWLDQRAPLGISSVAWAEFLCGPVSEAEVALLSQVLQSPIPFSEEDASRAARLFNLTGRRRGSFVDCMIAATAQRFKATLATSNPKDFLRFKPCGLEIAAG